MTITASENARYDFEATLTPDGGLAVQMINKTGAPSVKGTVVRNIGTSNMGGQQDRGRRT